MTDFHPFFVHFPVALFVTAGIIELMMWLFPKLPKQPTLPLFLIASLFSIPAALTGNAAEFEAGKITGIGQLLENHEIAGNFVTFLGITFSFFFVYMKLKFPKRSICKLRRVILLLMAVIVLYTGYLGGSLVQKFGAGVNPNTTILD
tara:strand:+ start:1223 stop:1663 length:441 start_codon:yes stop_codon:yes gene_type:complete